MSTTTAPLSTAHRVKFHEARRAFAAGARVLVSEYGDELTQAVGPSTTTHTRESTTWAALAEQVAMWRGRYPRPRFYVVESAS